MSKWLCIRKCVWGPNSKERQLWEVGDVHTGDQPICPGPDGMMPLRHFEELSKGSRAGDLSAEAIIMERLDKMNIDYDPEWPRSRLETLYDNATKELADQEETERLRKELTEMNIKFHPRAGLKKLRMKHDQALGA